MVKFINAYTGTEMLVTDDRVDEYLAVGHKLIANESSEEVKAVEPVKKATKATKKK